MLYQKESKSTFKPILKDYCDVTKEIILSDNFSNIFLPHTMAGYKNANQKIFYFGRDTYGWLPTKTLMQNYKENKLESYIEESSEWINEFGFLDYNKNKAFGFWTLAMRLHLRLKGIKDKITIGPSLHDNSYIELLNDFGYGNTNAIEVPPSLQNQGIWATIDKSKYFQVKEKSKLFDKLIHTVNVYKPDVIFIFNWACGEKLFLNGLNYTEEKTSLVNNQLNIYYLPDTNTKIIWTIHPRTIPFQSVKMEEFIETLFSLS